MFSWHDDEQLLDPYSMCCHGLKDDEFKCMAEHTLRRWREAGVCKPHGTVWPSLQHSLLDWTINARWQWPGLAFHLGVARQRDSRTCGRDRKGSLVFSGHRASSLCRPAK